LRAYHVAGRPPVEMLPWGSYQAWSQLIRAPLVWCGLPDPAQTRRGLASASDPERGLHARVLKAIDDLDQTRTGLTVGEIVDRVRGPENESHRAPLVEWDGRTEGPDLPHRRSLGMKLANIRDRVIDGRQLSRNGDRWLVSRLAPDGTGGPTGSRSGRSPSSPGEEGA